jgi:ferredoxin
MIIFARNRVETDFDTKLAEVIVSRFRAHVLSIPFLYDLRSFGPTLQRLRTIDEPSLFLAPFPIRASENLLNHLEIKKITAVLDVSDSDSERILESVEKAGVSAEISDTQLERLDELTVKRWYPVIDRKECIGCLECVNFCLFGVYIIGKDDKPMVDQPDSCRDGCPACARVCPGAAIMFPMYDDPNISGRTDAETVRQKIDPVQAEQERRRHRKTEQDELDDLVEQVDRFRR